MRALLRRATRVLAVLLALGAACAAAIVWRVASAYDQSVATRYDLPLPTVRRSEEPAVLERGRHLAESLGSCIVCHSEDLSGGGVNDMGPVGRIVYPNLTPGQNGVLADYSDAELARLLRHGIRRDGTTVRLMPVTEIYWWPDADRDALISYLRSLPPVDGGPPSVEIGIMGKLLDRLDSVPIDVARRVDHEIVHSPIAPAPTEAYGARLAIACQGCHGPTLSGGPVFGAPPDFPPPRNLTPHEAGLGAWTFEDFAATLRTGIRRDGSPLSSFMPALSYSHMREDELRALWLYLRSLPARPTGQR